MLKDSRIGIILNNLGPNQKAYFAIRQANLLHSKYDISLFIENMMPVCADVISPILSLNEIWPFRGTLIATDIEGALRLSKLTNPSRKIFYVYDLEWIRNKTNFIYNVNAFQDEKITLVARSAEHASLIERYSNRKVEKINPYFDLEEMIC